MAVKIKGLTVDFTSEKVLTLRGLAIETIKANEIVKLNGLTVETIFPKGHGQVIRRNFTK